MVIPYLFRARPQRTISLFCAHARQRMSARARARERVNVQNDVGSQYAKNDCARARESIILRMHRRITPYLSRARPWKMMTVLGFVQTVAKK